MQAAKSWFSWASGCREKPGLPAASGSPEASNCPMAGVSCDGSETEEVVVLHKFFLSFQGLQRGEFGVKDR